MAKQTDNLKARIRELCDGSHTIQEVADLVECREGYVADLARAEGLSVKPAVRPGCSNVFGWTEARVEALKVWYAEGKSASIISGLLGGGLSRNAVIGKIHRLGLIQRETTERRKSGRSSFFRRPKPAPPKPRKQNPFAHIWSAPVESYEPVNRADDVARKALVDLDPHDCRWPVGDPLKPDFGFCAAPRALGSPYCDVHHRCAYQPLSVRQRPPLESAPTPTPVTTEA